MKLVSIGIVALAFACGSAAAQEAYKAPRTSDGKADLQGVWTNASLTPLERAPGQPLVMPADRAAQMEKQRAQMMAAQNNRTNPNEGAPRAGQDVGGYNSFWIDPGSRYGVVKGETRTSWIVDPPDGRIPYSKAGKEAFDRKITRVRTTWDGPEVRPQGERCIVGFGSTGGPPMINVLYNNHYQIVQTPTHVMIMVEMNHDARVVPISSEKGGGKHAPASFRKWLGDSIGWWEGDTLVIDTVGYNEGFWMDRGELPHTNQLHTLERFTRTNLTTMRYELTIDDPGAYTAKFSGATNLSWETGTELFEYVCQQSNYAPELMVGQHGTVDRSTLIVP
jgi:hypothetical protein